MQWPQDKRKSGATSDLSPVQDPDTGVHLRQDVRRSGARLVKSALVGLTATGIVVGMTVPAAFASSTQVSWSQKNISFSSYVADGVSGYTENGTTFMPVWYVLQALQKSGYKNAFSGKVLSITSPANVTPNTTGLSVGTGNLSIEINGQVVKRVNSEIRIDPASGKSTQFIPIYYIQQILSALSFYNAWNGTDWSGRPVSVSMQGSESLEQGQMEAYSLQMLNPDDSYFIPIDPVTWSVSGHGAQIDKNTGVFSANTPGTYDVAASVDGFHWSEPVHVYGQAVGVQLSTSNTALVADGLTSSTITVKAVDSAGNLVTNFTGTVQLSIPTAGGTFVGGITAGPDNTIPVYLYDGTGTATLTSPTSAPSTGEAITASDMTSVSQPVPTNFTYSSLSITYISPVVEQIGITPSTTILNGSTGTSANLTLSLNDAAGNPVTSSLYGGMNVTLTITGPGSFAPGTSVTTTNVWVYPGTTTPSVPIYALSGQQGQVTVTASGDGVSGQTTLTSNTTGTGPTLSVQSQQGTLSSSMVVGGSTMPAGTPFTLYTVSVTDSNGNPLPQADTLWISDSTSTTSSGSAETSTTDELTYYSVNGTQPYQPLAWVSTNTYSVITSDATGKAQFIVFNTGNAPAGTTINIHDETTNATVTATSGSN